MSLVPIDVAMHHLRADSDDEADVVRKLAAAEEIAAQYMGRCIFADTVALEDAITTAKDDIADLVITSMPTSTEGDTVIGRLMLEIDRAKMHDMHMIARGIVINPAIEAAILLILGTLYEHREDVVVGAPAAQLPIAATHRLQPYRIMGV